MIEPPRVICGTVARTKLVTLVKFSSTSACCPLALRSRNSARKVPPALLTRMSTAPNAAHEIDHRVAVPYVEHGDVLGLEVGQALAVAIAHREPGTEAGQRFGDGPADAHRGTGDDGNPVGQQRGLGADGHVSGRLPT